MKSNLCAKFLLVAIFLSATACKDLDDLLTFYIPHQAHFTIESTSPVNLPLEIVTPEITTNATSEFENNNTRASLVKDIKLHEVKLAVVNPASKTFSFLKSIHVYISTDGASEILLAHREEIPAEAREITLEPTQERLDVYVKASSYRLRTKIVTRETLTESVDVDMNLKFKVTAAPL